MISIVNYRNIAICAHIDAGKTSLTERLLFITGKKHFIGEVHDGEATMDWLDQEKERGITISSACTTVYWKILFGDLYKINIIDTPGHIDFTAEVERSMRVLDGACIVLCAVAGVQSQTEAIWNQVVKYNIPRICFVNKMDRLGSDYFKIVVQLKNMFSSTFVSICYPLYKDSVFLGLVDLIEMKSYIYSNINPIINDLSLDAFYLDKKRLMIESIVETSDLYLNKYLNKTLVDSDLYVLLRNKTISMDLIPVICGSALKNKCVQNLLNAIVRFLPSPIDLLKNKQVCFGDFPGVSLVAFIFKVITDSILGRMLFVRIYSGFINVGDKVYNSSRDIFERIVRICSVHANKMSDINSGGCGDIVVLIGLKYSKTGDTLCNKNNSVILEKIIFPVPVISVSLILKFKSDYDKLLLCLRQYSDEDSTIKIFIDSGKVIVSGMGELHIEVFLENIRRVSGIKFSVGKPSVAFKQSIVKSVKNVEGKYIKQSGGRGQYGHVVLNVIPRCIGKGIKIVDMIKNGVIPHEYIKSIIGSIRDVLHKGINLRYSIVDVKVELVFGSFHEVDSNENAFKIAASIALTKAIQLCGLYLLEPLMLLDINIPSEYMGVVITDLISRRGIIISNKLFGNNLLLIKSFVPLVEIFNYSTILRSATKGRAQFSVRFNSYKKAPSVIFKTLLIKGEY